MLSPGGFSKSKFESIIGDLGKDLLRPKSYEVVKRGMHLSPNRSKDTTPAKSSAKKEVNISDEDDEEGKPKTITMHCGMIKFQDIVVPPSAPTDLICEECEVAISVLRCQRCVQVFCMKCAEACHPKAYGTDYHPHEVDGHMRAVQFGDTSRIKITNEFVLPDIAMSEEEYMKHRDLSKPQSLSTSLVASKVSHTAFVAPKYDVHQVVLFVDPHTEQEAYGTVISQWDQRHGTMATPAILRGEGSIVYYMVQLTGYTKHIANIATLIPPVSSVEKIDNCALIEGVPVDEMLGHRKNAHIIQKRIAAAEAVRRLGPKHHLRDVVNYGYEKDAILLDNREHGLNSTNPKYSGDQLLNSAIYNSNLDDMSECVTVASSTASQRQLIANKHRRLRMGTNNEYIITPVDFGDGLYHNVDLNVYADVDTDVHSQLSLDNPLAHPFPASHRSYQHLLHHSRVDAGGGGGSGFSINSASQQQQDDNREDGSAASSSGGRQPPARKKVLNMGAALKNAAKRTGKYINSEQYDTHNIYQSDDHRMQENSNSLVSSNQGRHDSSSQLTHHHHHHRHGGHHHNGNNHSLHSEESLPVDEYTKRALQVLVLKESELCTVQERIASEQLRKNALMHKVWDRLSGSERLLMKQHGFYRWQEKVDMLRNNAEHRAAIRIQSLGRMYLCRDKIAEKTEEFIARVRQKWAKVHAQFRYSDRSDPLAVTMDNKIYFRTHLDLNRYAALLRVLMYKLAKYLARKRMVMLRTAVARWRGGMTTFLEADIQSSHFNELAIDFDSTQPQEAFVSIAHQRNKITQQHIALHDLAAGVVLTSPECAFPRSLTDEVASHDTITALPLRLPDIPQLGDLPPVEPGFNQMMSFTHLSRPNTPAAGAGTPGRSRGGARSPSSKDGRITPGNASVRPLTGAMRPGARMPASATLPTADNSYLADSSYAVSAVDEGNKDGSYTMMSASAGGGAESPMRWDGVTFGASTTHSVHNGDSYTENNSSSIELRQDQFPSYASSFVDDSGQAATGSISNTSADAFPITHDIVPSYYPAQDMENLPPLPPIYIPRTAQERLHLRNERRLDYANFRSQMTGPTFDSSWVVRDILCMGSMPWGAAEVSNTEYPVFEDSSAVSAGFGMSTKSGKLGMESTKASGASFEMLMSASNKAMNVSTGISADVLAAKSRFKQERWKPPPVSSVSALLLNKIDVFVSLLDAEEEEAIEQACRVPSVQSCIRNALATANAAVSSIISKSTEMISKQTKQMDDIPCYGKSDPRFPAAYRETLRCKARIQLAQDNIAKAKQQIKNLPPHADFVRIPLRIDGLNTVNELMPKIWQLEGMLQQNRHLYIYSRDGHGRAGMVASILLGRLYNLHPYEALYRVQASHDSAQRDAKREIPINCPQLPVQRELVTQLLNLSNRPQELAFVRTQLDPETFVEHLPQRPLLYDATVHTSYSRSGGSNVSDVGGGVYRPPHAHPRGVTMVHSLVAAPQGSFSSLGEHSNIGGDGGGGGGDSVCSGTRRGGGGGGGGKMHRSLSWRSYQEAEAAAAARAIEAANNVNLGNNLEVQQAEQEFLEALFAAQNIRKKQALGMGPDAPYTWGRSSGITHRAGPVVHELSRTALPPEPLLPDLYARASLGQSVDVARTLPVKRPEPTQRPHLPHIRTALTPAPTVPLIHSSTYKPL